MYIFFLFFQFTMIPETTKDPGSICTIASGVLPVKWTMNNNKF